MCSHVYNAVFSAVQWYWCRQFAVCSAVNIPVSVVSALASVQWVVQNSVLFTLCSAQFSVLWILQCTVYSLQYTLYTVCTVYSVLCVYSLLCTVQSPLMEYPSSVPGECGNLGIAKLHCTQCYIQSVQCAVYSVHCAVCSVDCSLYTVHCTVMFHGMVKYYRVYSSEQLQNRVGGNVQGLGGISKVCSKLDQETWLCRTQLD